MQGLLKPGIPFIVPFSLSWGQLDEWNRGTPYPLPPRGFAASQEGPDAAAAAGKITAQLSQRLEELQREALQAREAQQDRAPRQETLHFRSEELPFFPQQLKALGSQPR